MEREPNIFLPINLRSGLRFRSLKRYCFSPSEKLWVCAHIVSSCQHLDKDLMTYIHYFCDKYLVKYSLVTAWINQYADGVSFSDAICPLDGDGIQAILGIVTIGSQTGESQTEYQKRLYICYSGERRRTSLNRGYT